MFESHVFCCKLDESICPCDKVDKLELNMETQHFVILLLFGIFIVLVRSDDENTVEIRDELDQLRDEVRVWKVNVVWSRDATYSETKSSREKMCFSSQ